MKHKIWIDCQKNKDIMLISLLLLMWNGESNQV